jgi:hypothetical protein
MADITSLNDIFEQRGGMAGSTIVKKGQWYSNCCYRDLCKAQEDTEVRHLRATTGFRVWGTRREALEELLKEEGDMDEQERKRLLSPSNKE